ncbi:MAG: hypothetical protein COA40_05240 [Aequorivita sp.]|nr:MAG: hypothetical protein COA40_05240 [Aequorivita sp.]
MSSKKFTLEEYPLPHLGTKLKEHIKTRRISKAALARAINKKDQEILRYQKRNSFQCALLWELSLVMKHNFFMDLAVQLPQEFSTYAPVDTSKDDRIAQLEDEVKMLTRERDLLSGILEKKG